MVVNLAELESVDPAAVGELVKASQVVRGLGGELSIIGLRSDMAEMLRMTGADQLIPLYDTAEQALGG